MILLVEINLVQTLWQQSVGFKNSRSVAVELKRVFYINIIEIIIGQFDLLVLPGFDINLYFITLAACI